MDCQIVPVLSTSNFHEWRGKVKSELIAYGLGVWKLVCDGYDKDTPSVQEQHWNAKAKCVIYNNLHNKDLNTIIDLKSAKEIWERLEFMHDGETSNNNAKNEKGKRKMKSPCQKESVQINETSTCVNIPDSHEEKTDENQARLDLSLVSIESLKNENKDWKKLVQICDEKEHEYKEKIVSLKTQL